jgi:hypothetical protein
MIAMKATQLNDRQSLKITQRLRAVIPFLSDREESKRKPEARQARELPNNIFFS